MFVLNALRSKIFYVSKALLSATIASTLSFSESIAETPSVPYSLSDLDFMVGHWQGSEEIGKPEEIWFPARDGIYTGVFRWPSFEGKHILELLTISKEDNGIIFRFKHFDPDITPWEKERANTYRLDKIENNCATFIGLSNPDYVPGQMQYCRSADDQLVFRGAKTSEAIEDAELVLSFRLLPRK